MNLRHLSEIVDERANDIKLSGKTKTANMVKTTQNLRDSQREDIYFSCHMVPYGLNTRYFGRSVEMDILQKGLCPYNYKKLEVIAIYGEGGVGITQLALQYANTSLDAYDVVLWIPAETQLKLTLTLVTFATKLGLRKAGDSEDDYQVDSEIKGLVE
ncbi:hypothetical protein AJ79_06306 [Helicocarpus griseus UAMH5409]|uniref:NB-ARC domain-containing protein n=1 Tax=Helicocarpus griseus UAMH5409 TaxID=1447875 RepID=A0A2B7X6X8_9EURO|nr:hypothetical protein AJ79_06306 [Helicocarpus griseus UAMH5409]